MAKFNGVIIFRNLGSNMKIQELISESYRS